MPPSAAQKMLHLADQQGLCHLHNTYT